MNDYCIPANLSLCAAPADTASRYPAASQAEAAAMSFPNHCRNAEVEGSSQWYRQQDIAHTLSLRQQLPQTGNIPALIGCKVETRADRPIAMLPVQLPVHMMSVAAECGRKFYFGSDSHSSEIFLRHHSDERIATKEP